MGFWSRKKLLKPGDQAPEATLISLEGSAVSLPELWQPLPLLLAFFKVSCPTCQLALPYLDRIHAAGAPLKICYVSQNDSRATREFIREFRLTALMLRDEAEHDYPVSNAFGISYVPTLFLIEPGGAVSFVSEGFVRQDLEALGERASVPLFRPGDHAPAYQPG